MRKSWIKNQHVLNTHALKNQKHSARNSGICWLNAQRHRVKPGERWRSGAGRAPEGLTNKSMAMLAPVWAACVTLWSKSDDARHHRETKESSFREKGSEAGRPRPPGPAGRRCPPPTPPQWPLTVMNILTMVNFRNEAKLEKRFDFTGKNGEFKDVDVLYIK